jgi:2-phospho-L-lactate transferase/gluconeogenesis factor (CofD/UPF0052 family)
VRAAAAVPALRQALAERSGGRVYVCNLWPQVPETTGFDAADHVDALRHHGIAVDVVIHDPGGLPAGRIDVPVVQAAVARPNGAAHDANLLGAVLGRLARHD